MPSDDRIPDTVAEERRLHRIVRVLSYGMSSMIVVTVLMALNAGFWTYAWIVLALAFASMAGRSSERLDWLSPGSGTGEK